MAAISAKYMASSTVDYLCKDGFNLEILQRGCTATLTFDKWHDIRCLRAEFTAKHEKSPIIAHNALVNGAWFGLMTVARYIALSLISWYHCLDPTNRDISGLHCIWHNMVILWNSHTVKQSRWWFCLIQIKHYSTRGPFHFGCAFPIHVHWCRYVCCVCSM